MVIIDQISAEAREFTKKKIWTIIIDYIE